MRTLASRGSVVAGPRALAAAGARPSYRDLTHRDTGDVPGRFSLLQDHSPLSLSRCPGRDHWGPPGTGVPGPGRGDVTGLVPAAAEVRGHVLPGQYYPIPSDPSASLSTLLWPRMRNIYKQLGKCKIMRLPLSLSALDLCTVFFFSFFSFKRIKGIKCDTYIFHSKS